MNLASSMAAVGTSRGHDTIAAHLTATYGVEVTSVVTLDHGLHRIERQGGDPWMARVFLADRPLERVTGDATVLAVLAGCAEIWVGEERATVTAGQSVIIPAGHRHGFRNNGKAVLHVEATLAAPMFEAAFEDLRETGRRWLPNLE